MKKLLFSLFLICLVKFSWACSERYPSIIYYDMFRQDLISNPKYFGFLYDRDGSDYYDVGDDRAQNEQNANLELWIKSFPQYSKIEFRKLKDGYSITRLKKESFENLSAIDQSIQQYFQFAHKIKQELEPKRESPWKYSTYLKQNYSTSLTEIIQEGLELYSKEKNSYLKQRYAYQLIKSLRYDKRFKDAIFFFTSEKLDAYEHNEIYYYTLDQLGGCYYNLKDYDTAMALFTKVSTHSSDRRNSAIVSYKFCLNHTNPKNVFKDKDEILNYHLLNSMSDFNDGVSILKSMALVDKNDDRIEVVFARNMSYLDRKIWEIDVYEPYDASFDFNALKKDLLSFAKSMRSSKNTSYWNFAYSYLLGINGHYQQAVNGFKSIKAPYLKEECRDFILLFSAMQWETTSDINQNFFKDGFSIDCDQDEYNPKHQYVKNIISRLFYKEKKYAKAFLTDNKVKTINNDLENEEIDQLISFIQKPNKSPLEKLLSENFDEHSMDNLLVDKGKNYLLKGDFTTAKRIFNSVNNDSKGINNSIFSNSLKAYCCSCKEQTMLTDSVYLSNIFSFIPPKMNYSELTESLLQLKQLSLNDSIWQGQLANYLLGNFYSNITAFGFYSDHFWGFSRCNKPNYDDFNSCNDFLPIDYWSYLPREIRDYSEADTALIYYNKVIQTSKNIELKARTTYLMAKCELYIINDHDLYQYKQEDFKLELQKDIHKKYSGYLKTLNSTYKNTEFHSKVIKECNYFEMYCN